MARGPAPAALPPAPPRVTVAGGAVAPERAPCRPPAPWGWPAAQTSAPSATATVGAGPTPACRQARDAARRGPRPQRDAAAGAALAAGPRRACLAASTPLRPGAGGAERSPPPRPGRGGVWRTSGLALREGSPGRRLMASWGAPGDGEVRKPPTYHPSASQCACRVARFS
jgi:hypothetical protein